MTNVALLIGNTQYQNCSALEGCDDDVYALEELVKATQKFNVIEIALNHSAAKLKSKIRSALEPATSLSEMFLYYSGHGAYSDDFYICCTDYDAKRPNVTGLSTDELHAMIREANPGLFVKVVDACNSGQPLIKSDVSAIMSKAPIRDYIQIASCLVTQLSLTGERLSEFTSSFINASLTETDGPVYYSDIINILKDSYLSNHDQTPHFLVQGTLRAKFVDSCRLLDGVPIWM